MANVKRRYVERGPSVVALAATTDPGVVVTDSAYYVMRDLSWDDSICDVGTMDDEMRRLGYTPDAQNTIVLAPVPFLGIQSPNGTAWGLAVSDLGVLTVIKTS